MPDQTSSSIVIAAPPAAVMGVIADFPAYVTWAQGVHTVKVLETFPDGRAKEVYFEVEEGPVKDHYTLAYRWQGVDRVDWWLTQGRMLRKLDGTYALRPVGGAAETTGESTGGTGGPGTASHTEVTYRLAVDLHIPMIGMLKRKAEKVIVDSALRGLKHRTESLA